MSKPIRNPPSTLAYGVSKIQHSCALAKQNKIEYMWVNTCCINKTNNAELTESINSMFNWYRLAKEYYVYLRDVDSSSSRDMVRRSRWFTRGWTLQELLTPSKLIFFDREWNPIGTKSDLEAEILAATSIHRTYLLGDFKGASIATKMSWAARRETAKVEDRAYSLVGLFDITLEQHYGEGRRAFRRLQETLIERVPDESIFAWTKEGVTEPHGILAPWLDYFQGADTLTHRSSKSKPRPPYRLTNQGLNGRFQTSLQTCKMGRTGITCWRVHGGILLLH